MQVVLCNGCKMVVCSSSSSSSTAGHFMLSALMLFLGVNGEVVALLPCGK